MKKEKNTEDLKQMFGFNELQCLSQNKCYHKIEISHNTQYVKYASRRSAYDILDSDELFMFCSELSNDTTENKIVPGVEKEDIYITCFYHTDRNSGLGIPADDVYSQWMSYCKDGGAAFEFYFGQDIVGSALKHCQNNYDDVIDEVHSKNANIFDYSIIIDDGKDNSDYIKYPQYPFQVQYFKTDSSNIMGQNINLSNHTFFQNLKSNLKNMPLSKITPYLKDNGFMQESEARLVFVNENNYLADCIRFLKSDNDRIPYIRVKFGNKDDILSPCGFLENYAGSTLDEKAENFFKSVNPQKYNSMMPIIIPQGHDQENVYNAIEKQVKKYNKKFTKPDLKISIICQGHLPITKITLAPTRDRNEQKKMMEIYCKSKYWLRNVEICTSVLPYNTKNINHT